MSSKLPADLDRALYAALEDGPVRASPIAGGDIARSYAVELRSRRRVFVKTHAAGAAMFEAEAAGLRWLAEAGALRIPEVLAVGQDPHAFLCLEYLESASPSPDHDERLGAGLARLHLKGAEAYGFPTPNFVGAVPQSGRASGTWAEFYGEYRLAPLVERAADHLGHNLVGQFDRLRVRLPQLCGPEEGPSRLHGDLWGGNAITGPGGEPVLIDPAVYGGHREVDLAMMRLFGGFSERVFAAYNEANPLAPGAEERVSLYQLYPLLVHVILFGGSYVGGVAAALRRYA